MPDDAVPPAQGTAKVFVCDLVRPGKVASYFICSAKEVSTQRNGQSFLKLSLRDASGEIKGIHWDADESLLDTLQSGDVVKVVGAYSEHPQYGPQLKVDQLRVLHPGEYDPETLVQVAPVPYQELRQRLDSLVAGIADRHILALTQRALDTRQEPGATFMTAPAAVRNHHAYRHGLLEHSVQVAEAAASVADRYPQVQRDVVVAGALLHDLGKTQAYGQELMAPSFTDAGRLEGEIVLGYRILIDLIREQPDFPVAVAARLQHVLIAHHGQREKGSPAVPMTREAIIVHYCDDMTARLAAFDEAEAETRRGDRWTAYSRMHETALFVEEAPGAGGAPADSDAPPVTPGEAPRVSRPDSPPVSEDPNDIRLGGAACPAPAAAPQKGGGSPAPDDPQTLLEL